MRIVAGATGDELAAAVATLGPIPPMRDIRPPETGLVMVRGRVGGDGAPFNLGEATVTRAAVASPTGETGQGHVLGRHKEKARHAAVLDACWQSPAHRSRVEAALEPSRLRQMADRHRAASEAAATKVDFFTVARGDD